MPAPIGPNAARVTADAHRVGVEIDVSEIVSRLEREALRLVNDYSQQGLTGDALAEAVSEGLRGLSDVPLERAGRGAASEAFNLGRNLQVQQEPEMIGSVIRTEVMDRNTCDPCRALDGREVAIDSPEYLELMPPNRCLGRELCRGFYIYEAA